MTAFSVLKFNIGLNIETRREKGFFFYWIMTGKLNWFYNLIRLICYLPAVFAVNNRENRNVTTWKDNRRSNIVRIRTYCRIAISDTEHEKHNILKSKTIVIPGLTDDENGAVDWLVMCVQFTYIWNRFYFFVKYLSFVTSILVRIYIKKKYNRTHY